ncbi:DUF1761 domain-containing protein [Candidatus Gracilibacteria bacterium]|nr:DUF1761 domain-containing protein [Candidatus Gracilibacteria bacterium]
MDFFTLMFAPFAHLGILAGGTLFFFVLGWFWYNPITPIGKKWMSYFPAMKEDKVMKTADFAFMLLFQFFMGFVVTHTVMAFWMFVTQNSISEIFATLFLIKMYMGFVFIKELGHWFFEKKPFLLILISVGYYLIGILGVCALLSYYL